MAISPKEVLTFVRMLDALTDPDKIKTMNAELVAAANRASTMQDALNARYAEVQAQEKTVNDARLLINSDKSDLERRERDIKTLSSALADREVALDTKEIALNARATDLDTQADANGKKQMELKQREQAVAEKEAELTAKQNDLDTKTAIVDQKMAQIKSLAG